MEIIRINTETAAAKRVREPKPAGITVGSWSLRLNVTAVAAMSSNGAIERLELVKTQNEIFLVLNTPKGFPVKVKTSGERVINSGPLCQFIRNEMKETVREKNFHLRLGKNGPVIIEGEKHDAFAVLVSSYKAKP